MSRHSNPEGCALMKPAHWMFRLWGIRHVRAMVHTYRINRHYNAWAKFGFLPTNADKDWEIVGRIQRGDL